MSSENTISDFIIETQIAIFDYARTELQKPLKVIADDCRVPYATVQAWASGRNGLSLTGVKLLLRAPYMAPLLSRLIEPEEYTFTRTDASADHDDLAANCIDFTTRHSRARHPKSEAGVNIGPNEDRELKAARARLRA